MSTHIVLPFRNVSASGPTQKEIRQMTRTFTNKRAVRSSVPLLIGLAGPSGGGKTFSALRLGTGIQRIAGGGLFLIDTETRRALHYADRFNFEHVQFDPPFGSLDYLTAIQHCVAQGARTIIIDSFSHEHEGPGGVLEQHESEVERLAKEWKTSRGKVQFPAWATPKANRRRMLNTMIQLPVNFVLCFRAKEKAKPKGQELLDMGWMPIGGDEILYEMTARALLPPNADGVPVWRAERVGEKLVYKLPAQFRDMFKDGQTLTEEHGEAMAVWARGDAPSSAPCFSPRLKWSGLKEWGGKELGGAPGGVLVAYAVEVEAAMGKASARKRTAMAAHLKEVRELIGSLDVDSGVTHLDANRPKELLDMAAEAAAHEQAMAEEASS